MNGLGDHAMKIQGTLLIAALAIVVGAFPALANQSQKSPERVKTERKIDAAARTPFMTPQQGANLKRAVDGGEQMKANEKVSQEQPVAPGTPAGQQAPVSGEQAPPAEPPAQPETPKPEPQLPEVHLMGTVCGTGPDLAIFNRGEAWPTMLKVGDKLDDATKIISIGHGSVVLERVTMVTPPAPPAPVAQVTPQSPDSPAPTPPAPPKPVEKRERFELFSW